MLTPSELRTLDAVLACLVPGHEESTEVVAYVLGRVATAPDLYRAGLILLQAHGFDRLDPSEREELLQRLEAHPSIALMVQHAIEGAYTSPAGLASVGFRVTA